jgi:hypothetical protein
VSILADPIRTQADAAGISMRIAACLAEVGWPNAIGGVGQLLDQSVPPSTLHKAWSIGTDSQATFAEWVEACLSMSTTPHSWRAYFRRHEIEHAEVTGGES